MTFPIINKQDLQTVSATTAIKYSDGTNGGAGNKLVFKAVTGLTGTIQISHDQGANYINVDTFDDEGNYYAAGTTITFTAGMELMWEGAGGTHVQITKVGGTSATVRLVTTFAPWSHMVALLRRLGGSATASGVTGNVAHDGADAGNPVKIGAKAETAISGVTLVADGDRTDLYAGVDGVLITRQDANLEDLVSGAASNTDGSSTQCIAAQSSGIKTYLTGVVLVNTSASGVLVEIKDGTTVKAYIYVPATNTAGAIFHTPIAGTAATAWNFDPGAATTTVYCTMTGFKSKV